MNSTNTDRITAMSDIAATVTDLICRHGRRDDIVVTYVRPTDEDISEMFSAFQVKYHRIFPGLEYFMIWENPDQDMPASVALPSLLYAVNVTADSVLTAAHELLDLVHRKF